MNRTRIRRWFPVLSAATEAAARSIAEKRHWSPLASIVACFAAFDLFVAPAIYAPRELSDFPGLAEGLLGAVTGQAGLLLVWAALGPADKSLRFERMLLLLLALYVLFVIGSLAWQTEKAAWRNLAEISSLHVMLFIAAQSPLWCLRLLRGWQIEHGEGGLPNHVRRLSTQFTIGHLLRATAVLALLMGLLRLTPGVSLSDLSVIAIAFVALSISGGVCCALGVLPCLWAAFIAEDEVLSLCAVVLYIPAMAFLPIFLFWISDPGVWALHAIWAVLCYHAGLVLVLLGSLFFLRYRGYVLTRPFSPAARRSHPDKR